MANARAHVGIEEDWELARDVVIQKPLGVVLSIRLDHSEIDQISRAAEALGMTSYEFLRQAALLVANEPSLRDRLRRSKAELELSEIDSGT